MKWIEPDIPHPLTRLFQGPVKMSDTADYYVAHALDAQRRADELPNDTSRAKQQYLAKIYRALAREAICANLGSFDRRSPQLIPVRATKRGLR